MARRAANTLRETTLPVLLLAGDMFVTFAGLLMGFWLRYVSPISRIGVDVPGARLNDYYGVMVLGVLLPVASFAQLGLYDGRLLLRRFQSLNLILKGTAFWCLIYLVVSFVIEFDPPISRLFVALALVSIVTMLYLWRFAAYTFLTQSPLLSRVQRRSAMLGWGEEARAIASDLVVDRTHPLSLAGIITLPGDPLPSAAELPAPPEAPPLDNPWLGAVDDLDRILADDGIDVLIITRSDLPPGELKRIVERCERSYVDWKIVQGTLEVFVSSLSFQTIGKMPLLGIEGLAINTLFNRMLKRGVDIVGSLVGLALSAPFLAVLAILIKRESPEGPVMFRQTRIGVDHRPFMVYKLRSMVAGAEATDAERQSTARNDTRLLRIGEFMRRWNLDETPQFWNVLWGDMSLVGPRPERPVHVERLSHAIPHYMPRHLVKPGMTGWAQVNGYRGEGDLTARIKYDIYYIENWNLWFDVQIMLMTFVRWKNAY